MNCQQKFEKYYLSQTPSFCKMAQRLEVGCPVTCNATK